jgi:pilus assembly protein CpaF
MLPDGHRLHVVLDGISRDFVAVNVRKFVVRAGRLSELADLGSLTPQAARFLEASVVAGLNIVVSGGTQAGKTTMLNCLGSAVPGRERIISVEEVFELKLSVIPPEPPAKTFGHLSLNLPYLARRNTPHADLSGADDIQGRPD